MASKRKPALPKAVEAWAVVRDDGHILRQTLWIDRTGGRSWANAINGTCIRVRIVPIARKRRRVGK